MQFDTERYLNLLKTKNVGRNILYLNETSSTNDEVWDHIKKNNHIKEILSEYKKVLEYDQNLITDYYNLQNQYDFFKEIVNSI